MRTSEALSILRIVFVRNGYWKLLSLVIAVLIYFSIRSEISHVRIITVPVETEFESVGLGSAIESSEPRSVQVTLRGSYSEVNQLALPAVRCVVRPKQKKGALLDTVAVKIGHGNLRGVRGLRVLKVDPNVVVVKFDVPMTVELAVAPPAVEGKARGIAEPVYEQTRALVKGSRRLLSTLDPTKVQIQPEAINVEGRSQTFSARVRLIPPGDVANLVVEPPEMVVNVKIISEKSTVKLERVPVVVSQPYAAPNRWKTDPEWIDVELTGRSEVVQAIRFGEITATVNGNLPLTPNETNEVPVMVHVQQGLSIDGAKPMPERVKLIPLAPVTAGAPLP